MATVTFDLKDYQEFVVTGKDTRGKRFSMHYAATPSGFYTAMGINLYHGSVWGIRKGAEAKRELLKRVGW
jgi:hypothetical protein